MTIDGIQVHAASKPFNVYGKTGNRSIGAGLRLSGALTRALSRSSVPFDVLDCSLYPFFHIFGARVVRPRTPTVVTWYEYWGEHWYEYLGWRGFFGKQVEHAAAKAPHRIIAVSQLVADGLRRQGIPDKRVELIPLGVDSRGIELIPPSTASSDVVFFGRLKNHKNVDLLLRAIALVREKRPKVTCAVIGDGPERGRLQVLARQLAIDSAVRFYGEVDDDEMLAIVKASKIFVHPSTKEGGASTTLLEANACGLPVIAVRHELGFDPWLIEHGVNGWWVRDSDPASIARAILDALSLIGTDVSMRNAVNERCRSFARASDLDRMTDRCEELYFEVSRVGRLRYL